ncbi:MAG: hypothetical protein MR660_07535, partial [Peptoniphilaceae bacterium]|nr:hypothetical protein [Peptoniphilaceae bacterium]
IFPIQTLLLHTFLLVPTHFRLYAKSDQGIANVDPIASFSEVIFSIEAALIGRFLIDFCNYTILP